MRFSFLKELLLFLSFIFLFGLLSVFEPDLLSWAEDAWIAKLWPIRGERPASPELLLVEIDEKTCKKFSWPWSPATYANLVRALDECGAEAILFDKIICAGEREEERALQSAFVQSGRVFLPVRTVLGWEGETLPGLGDLSSEARTALEMHSLGVPVLKEQALARAKTLETPSVALMLSVRGLGFIPRLDEDSASRFSTPLLIEVNGVAFPSLELGLLVERMGVSPEKVRIRRDGGLVLEAPGEEGRRGEDFLIPTDKRGMLPVNFSARPAGRVSAGDVLEANSRAERDDEMLGKIRGKTCIVSHSAFGLGEVVGTPLGEMPLARYRAKILSTLIYRSFLWRASWWFRLIIVAVLLGIVEWLFQIYPAKRVCRWAAAICLVYLAFVAVAFLLLGWLLPVVLPVVALVCGTSTVYAYRRLTKERYEERLRAAFAGYFSPEVTEEVVKAGGVPTMEGVRKSLTVLSVDFADFAPVADGRAPSVVIEQLREFFSRMRKVVFDNGGMLSRVSGDSALALFGEPNSFNDAALRGVRAAVALRKMVAGLNEDWLQQGKGILTVRLALATGPVVVGDFDPEGRAGYTAVGRAVAVGEGMRMYASAGEIVVDEDTARHARDFYYFRDFGLQELPSVHERVRLFMLVDEKRLAGEC